MGSAKPPFYFRTIGCWLVVPHIAVLCYTFMFAIGTNWNDNLRLLAMVVLIGLLLHIPAYLLFRYWRKNVLHKGMSNDKQP